MVDKDDSGVRILENPSSIWRIELSNIAKLRTHQILVGCDGYVRVRGTYWNQVWQMISTNIGRINPKNNIGLVGCDGHTRWISPFGRQKPGAEPRAKGAYNGRNMNQW